MQNFSIFKNVNKKEGSTAPDYKMSMKIGEEYVDCGACWLKEGKSGKYFSCKLADTYVDKEKGVAKPGFQIVSMDIEVAESNMKYPQTPNPDDIPF